MPDQTFTKDEIARIIKRAGELESERSDTNSEAEGLTLEELNVVASDAGIDPELVRRAAEEIQSPGSAKKAKGKSGVEEKEIFAEHWLDHLPDEETIDNIIADLDYRFRDSNYESWYRFGKPKTSRTGKTVEWTYTDINGLYETRVLMQPQGKRYRVRVSRRNTWGGTWGPGMSDLIYFLPVFFAFTFAANATDSFFIGVALAAALMLVIYPLLKKYRTRNIQKHFDKTKSIADEIIDHLNTAFESRAQDAAKTKKRASSETIEINDESPAEKEKDNPDRQKNILRNKD